MSPKATRTLLIAAIVVLLGVLVVLFRLFLQVAEPPGVVRVKPDGLEWVQSIYGAGQSDADQFQGVYSVALGPEGDIYATDPGRSRVMVFSRFGEYKRTVETGGQGTGQGEFKRPAAIDVDNLSRLYVADSSSNKVVVFAEDGSFIREWPIPAQARGVTVEGPEVYVLGEGTVYVYDLSGVLLRQWGTRGRDVGQIDAYQGIVVHEGRVYIADAYNKRIQAFDTNGTLAWANPATSTPTPSFESTSASAAEASFKWDLPQDLTVDGAGRLVVIDAFRFQLVVVDPNDGSVLESYGDFGTNEGEFFYPTSIEYDAVRDRFVVADTQNRRVQIVTIPDSAAGAVTTTIRRVEASPTRFLIAPILALLIILVVSVVQWRRWGRVAPENVK